MADYTLSTSNARQDAALAQAAARAGAASVTEYVRAQFARVVQRAADAYEQDIAARLPAAYLAATPAKQAAAKTALNLD